MIEKFSFIASTDFRKLLEQDYKEINTCIDNGHINLPQHFLEVLLRQY